MPYYETLQQDVARAKEILAKGKLRVEEFDVEVPPDLAAVLVERSGTIVAADTYAAYKLLESFVEELAARERIIETYEAQLAKRDEELFTLRAVAKELEQEVATFRPNDCLCRTRGCGHMARLHVGGICQACACEGWR
jgi:chromosome segregation ATPase